MNKIKIFNDPVYGFIRFPHEFIYELINHPFFQRLRRISQLGFSHYVYPGAVHTRFHHALGAAHLMTKAIGTLRAKGIVIEDKEAEAVCIAILLHDIGHGPFSHSLEGEIIDLPHEDISLAIMERLNEEFDGKLDLAISIFEKKYEKNFLTQLVSSQLDMDRMDYLNRDSFYTGVAEGIIGYDRIIEMFNVVDGQLVIEEKALFSIEKFLMARRIMYWQVYLHKTVIAIEKMLVLFFTRLKSMMGELPENSISATLRYFLQRKSLGNKMDDMVLANYASLDDFDIYTSLKSLIHSNDFLLSFLAKSIINRNLFKIKVQNDPFLPQQIDQKLLEISINLNIPDSLARSLLVVGKKSNLAYHIEEEEILILKKDGSVHKFSETTDFKISGTEIHKHYLCAPETFNPK